MLLVAGANGGIGAAVARELARAGARLHLGYFRRRDAIDELLAAAPATQLSAGSVDVRDYASVRAWVDDCLAQHGSVNGLACCVGTALPPVAFFDLDPERWPQVLEPELMAVLNLSHVVAPLLAAQGAGRIAVLSSDSGRVGAIGQVVSSAARGGVNALCKALAREVARSGVTINAVCPGPVEGPALDSLRAAGSGAVQAIMRSIPIGRPTRPEEVAALFRFLLLDQAGAITGQVLSVNGGLSMV
ncbi:MAG TPA: SDR family oxidoreductase [Micromonosporaceae bacterium]